MARGRKTTPENKKVIQGTFRKDRADIDAPKFDIVEEFPQPPLHLNADGVAMWKDLGKQLVAVKVLQVVDLYLLEQLCYTWQRFRQKARAGSDSTAAETGALKSLFCELGMTPASRSKVHASGEKPAGNKFASNGKKAGNQ